MNTKSEKTFKSESKIKYIHIEDAKKNENFVTKYEDRTTYIGYNSHYNYLIVACENSYMDKTNILKDLLSECPVSAILSTNALLYDSLYNNFMYHDVCYQGCCITKLNIDNENLPITIRFVAEAENHIIEAIGKSYFGEKQYEKNCYFFLKEMCRENRLMAAFDFNNNLLGYIGIHYHGAIGMLYVFEKYRHKGYGSLLVKNIVNYKLEQKMTPYVHVINDNSISIHLLSNLGFCFDYDNIYWLYNDLRI